MRPNLGPNCLSVNIRLWVYSMPKKWKGDNPKAVEARERRESKKQVELERKQRAEEDAYWKDDDKYVQRKEQRKVSTKCGAWPECGFESSLGAVLSHHTCLTCGCGNILIVLCEGSDTC